MSNLLGLPPGSNLTAGDQTPIPGATYTFANGVTLTGSTVTNDLTTGIANGQDVTGGTGAAESLTLKSTGHPTKGKIYFGGAGASYYDENAELTGGGGSATAAVMRLGGGSTFRLLEFAAGGSRVAAIGALSFGVLIMGGVNGITFYSNDFANQYWTFSSNGNSVLGGSGSGYTDAPASTMQIQSVKTVASSAGAVWDAVKRVSGTLTLTGVTGVTEIAHDRIERPTLTSAGAVVVTDAATIIIDGEPIAGGSLTIGTGSTLAAKALWLKRGAFQADGVSQLGKTGTHCQVYVDGTSGQLANVAGSTLVQWNATGLGFFGVAPIAKPTVTGAKAGNAALASLCTALANLGLITNSTT